MFAEQTQMPCPTCGKVYKSLGRHYREKPGHRPTLDEEDMDMLSGILMGDGTIPNMQSNSYPVLKLSLTRPRYLIWLQRHYPYLFNSVSREKRQGSKDVFHIHTIPHPQLYELKNWYHSGEKRFPAHINLTPTLVKHWYCCDGGLNWSGNSDSGASARIHSSNEEIGSLIELFNQAGFEPANHNERSLYFSREETPTLLGWMGGPPDGFEYKWEWNNRPRYQELKDVAPVVDDTMQSLSNQLIHTAARLQQVTTVVDEQRRTSEVIKTVESDYETKLESLEEDHQAELEKAKENAREEAKREERNRMIRALYDHPEVDVSQRILGECVGLTQQQIGNIARD